ncbi:60S ribosomal export NMD3-like [Micractinium conductrix]|uniref:60S ribosomal export protein NMD3 n=1 Tax=Micractinium conductrix TaxID=554055 RepID=A0A2P6VFH9_9CHLO|nr:60S ribosomal export NMD3-like [Micractinium conductrix]|eukprot:PSC72831.1 60S ribosomal export NMD3-like [Micractinium conductrix]
MDLPVIFANAPGAAGTFLPHQTQGHVLCCLCGTSITPNPTNMCVNCIRTQVDITEGIQKQVTILWCKSCGRYLQPPKHWLKAELESKELLTFCIKRVKGLSKVKLVDAAFIWTEPHSMRLKAKMTVQGEVLNGAILQQAFVVEYIVERHMCPTCNRQNANPNMWVACVQVRQHVQHKRTFFFLEQLILKHGADEACVNVKEMHEGVDFYFANRSHAVKFIDFLQTMVPIRYRHDKQLVSHDEHTSTYNYKFTFSVEIAPLCKDDLVCLPAKLAASLGNIGPVCLVTRVTNAITLTDPLTLRRAILEANAYWRYSLKPCMSSRQLTEFYVLDAEPAEPQGGAWGGGGGRYSLASCELARAADFGRNDATFFARTHLGHLLHPGDTAMGYDVANANLVDPEVEKAIHKGLTLPDAVLVRKSYEDKRRRRRARGDAARPWRLKRLAMDIGEEEAPQQVQRGRCISTAEQEQQDMERFLQELEEDADMRARVALYKDPAFNPAAAAPAPAGGMADSDEEDGDVPQVPLEELLEDLAALGLDEGEEHDGSAPRRQHPARRGVLVVAAYQTERAAPPKKPKGAATAAAPPAVAAAAAAPAAVSNWPCRGGALVKVLQQSAAGPGGSHQVTVVLDGSLMAASGERIPRGATVQLHWGVYRSSPHLWQHPAEVVPPGSAVNERSGAMVTPMAASADGATYTLTLTVPATLAPLTLGFVVRVEPPAGGGRPHFVKPLRGRHFSALLGCAAGSGAQQGATLLPTAAPPAAAPVAVEPQQQDATLVPAAAPTEEASPMEATPPQQGATLLRGAAVPAATASPQKGAALLPSAAAPAAAAAAEQGTTRRPGTAAPPATAPGATLPPGAPTPVAAASQQQGVTLPPDAPAAGAAAAQPATVVPAPAAMQQGATLPTPTAAPAAAAVAATAAPAAAAATVAPAPASAAPPPQPGKAAGKAVLSDSKAPSGAGEAGAPQQQRSTVNFSVRLRGADRVCLVLLRPQPTGQEWGLLELVLDPVVNRSGDLWHIAVEGLHSLEGLCYGWRLDGDVSWESGCRIQPYQLLVDPCCSSLRYFPATDATDGSPLPLPTVELPDGSTVAVLSSLEGLAAEQARQAAAAQPAAQAQQAPQQFVPGPDYPLEELRVLEVDVRTFAQGKEVQHRGRYLGVAERAAHIKAVGANTVILTPSYATAKGIGLLSRAAVHLMAADPTLASDGASSAAAAAAEFRQMVSTLHAAGIEVIVTLEVTFTAEGTDSHPNPLSLRGLDYGSYYRSNGVLNCGDPATRDYLLRVLRHWAGEGVDGFCFMNAENLVLDREGTVLDAPPLADAICHDPVLRHLKLVALASNDSLLPRGGARGFPHWGLWQQRNTAFGADLIAFLAEGTPGLLTKVADRLTGSARIFDSDWHPEAALPGNLAIGRRPAFGMNSVTVLGRQSLAELSAEAAELAGAAAAREGMPPGPAPSAATIAKSLLALSILALGTPIVAQDTVADLAAARFVGVLMRMRRRLAPLLLPPRFDSPRDIRWHSATDASVEPIWDTEAVAAAVAAGHRSTNYLAFSVHFSDGQCIYVGVNAHPHAVAASLPRVPAGRVWEVVVDTALPPPNDAFIEGGYPVRSPTYLVAPKAVLLLQATVDESGVLPVGVPPHAAASH